MYYVLRYTPVVLFAVGLCIFMYHIPPMTPIVAAFVGITGAIAGSDIYKWMDKHSSNATAAQITAITVLLLAVIQGWRMLSDYDRGTMLPPDNVVTLLGCGILIIVAFVYAMMANTSARKHRNNQLRNAR